MRSGNFFGSQMGTDGRRSDRRRWAVAGLGISLGLLLVGVAILQRWQVERANELFRQRMVLNEYCFEHACNVNPYAEF
jgi:hypothetical protein